MKRQNIKKMLAAALSLVMMLMLLPVRTMAVSAPEKYTYDVSEGNITIEPGSAAGTFKVTYGGAQVADNIPGAQNITLTGSTTSNFVNVNVGDAAINLTFDNLNIDRGTTIYYASEVGRCAVCIAAGAANVTLVGESILTGLTDPSCESFSALFFNSNGPFEITKESTGSLELHVGRNTNQDPLGMFYGSGLVISGGTLKAASISASSITSDADGCGWLEAGFSGSVAISSGVWINTGAHAGTVYGSPTLAMDEKVSAGTTLTVGSGTSLIIPDGKTLTVEGKLELQGSLTNSGTLICSGAINTRGGTLTNNGTVTNTGYIFTYSGALGNAGSFSNQGLVYVASSTMFTGTSIDRMLIGKLKDEPYIKANGEAATISEADFLAPHLPELGTGWYALGSNTSAKDLITVTGDVNLILTDGATLNADAGINVSEGSSLTVWGQSGGTGTLIAIGGDYQAGIGGGDGQSAGTLTFNGGVVRGTGGKFGAGIGGGRNGSGGAITINGGSVTGIGTNFPPNGFGGAGIGSGEGGANTIDSISGVSTVSGGVITINGGTVTAQASCFSCAGIGGAAAAVGATVTVNGGTVNATGGECAAGIGNGYGSASSGSLTVTGGAVNATGGMRAAGIGGGYGCAGSTVNISGGTVAAIGGSANPEHTNWEEGGAGIGGGGSANYYEGGGAGGSVTISGGTVTATSGLGGAGIGATNKGASGTFSTGTNGHAWINAGSISDQSGKTANTWSGVIFEGDAGAVYGSPTLTADTELAASKTLTIVSGAALTIGSGAALTIGENTTLTNNGGITVQNGGTLTIVGDAQASENSSLTKEAGGTVNRRATTTGAPEITARADTSASLKTVVSTRANPVQYGYTAGSETNVPESRWQASPSFTGLSANTAYTLYVRHAGSDYYLPSVSSGLAISTMSVAPGVAVTDTAADVWTLSTTAAMEYSTDSGANWTPCTKDMAAAALGWSANGAAKPVLFRYAAVGGGDASAAQSYAIPPRAATPNVTADYAAGTADTTAAMEYSTDGGANWTPCTANMTLAALGRSANGETAVLLRVKTSGEVYASTAQTLTMRVRQSITAQPTADSLTFGVTTAQGAPSYQWQRLTSAAPLAADIGASYPWTDQGSGLWRTPMSGLSTSMHSTLLVRYTLSIDNSTLSFHWGIPAAKWGLAIVDLHYALNGANGVSRSGTLQQNDNSERQQDITLEGLAAGEYTLVFDYNYIAAMPPLSDNRNGWVQLENITGAENIDGAAASALSPLRVPAGTRVRCTAVYPWGETLVSDFVAVPPLCTLTAAAPAFEDAVSGYAQPAAKTLTLTNSGNTAAAISAVTVDSGDFIIGGSGAEVASGGSIDTWTVQPKAGLSIGTHSGTVTVVYNNGTAATAEVKFTVNPKNYTILEGAGQQLTLGSGSGEATTFRSDAEFAKFVEARVDGVKVAAEHITVTPGSTIVTLKVEYVAALAAGTHTLAILSTDGEADTTFTIVRRPENAADGGTTARTFTITASADAGGSFDTAQTVTVGIDESARFAITPDKGYRIADVKVDGKSVGAVGEYVFTHVTDNHTISATFEKIATTGEAEATAAPISIMPKAITETVETAPSASSETASSPKAAEKPSQSTTESAASQNETASAPAETTAQKQNGAGWLWLIPVGAITAFLLILLGKKHKKNEQ